MRLHVFVDYKTHVPLQQTLVLLWIWLHPTDTRLLLPGTSSERAVRAAKFFALLIHICTLGSKMETSRSTFVRRFNNLGAERGISVRMWLVVSRLTFLHGAMVRRFAFPRE